MGEDLDGLVHGGHQEPAGQQVEHRVGLHLPEHRQQAGGQAAQAGKLGKVGRFPKKVDQLVGVGDQLMEEFRQQLHHVKTQAAGIVLAQQGIPPDKAQVADDQYPQYRPGGFSLLCQENPFLQKEIP